MPLSALMFLVVSCGVVVPYAHAEVQLTEVQCKDQIVERLQNVHDRYRQVLFGSVGSEKLNKQATALKSGGILSENAIDLLGIFETKGRLTSELVDPLVESYRVFRCKSLNLCDALAQSVYNGKTSTVQHLGCASESIPTFDQCAFAGKNSYVDAQGVIEYCNSVVETTLQAEQSALKLAVSYDSGYRSLVQVAGMFDAFLKDFARQAFLPLRQMVALLGKLHQIPCFLPQCDLPPDDIIKPQTK